MTHRPPMHVRIGALVLLSIMAAIWWIGVWAIVTWIF